MSNEVTWGGIFCVDHLPAFLSSLHFPPILLLAPFFPPAQLRVQWGFLGRIFRGKILEK